MKIVKRDGTIVDFDCDKIKKAILKANTDVDKLEQITDVIAEELAKRVERYYSIYNNKVATVEDVQDQVEYTLMTWNYYELARQYIRYRYKRELSRDKYSALKNAVKGKLSASDVQNQNANVDEHSFGGRMGEANSLMTKQIALEDYMSKMARNNHLNNEIYIHDLDSYSVGMHNCLSIPFDDLLANGCKTRQTDIRPAGSINTAFQLVAVIFQLQSLMQFGGVSATHLDWTMVPYVRKSFKKHYLDGAWYCSSKSITKDLIDCNTSIDDRVIYDDEKAYNYAIDMTERELKQAVEGMYHNLNTLQSRSGNQLPFTSINYGTCTLTEGRMVIRALLEGSLAGVGAKHITPIFPCGIFQCMKGVNRAPGEPNYDLFQLALKSTSKRLYPNYANVDWSGNAGYDRNDPRTYFSTMGCRTANGYDVNGFGQLKDGRGNICPVTIIMPTLAMEANGDIEKFMSLLDIKIHEAREMLIERFEWICSQSPASAPFMYDNCTMAGYVPEEGIRSALKHGTLAIGQLGLAETLQILIHKNHLTPEGMELAKRIENLFKTRCAEFKEQDKLNFGVYYTPAENLCGTAMKKFKDKYGVIPNVSDKKFFTNSIHVPVWEKVTPFEKIDIESQLTGYSSAGCITYVEFDSTVQYNLKALETVVNYAMDKDIPYFAVNVPCDTCLDCGYSGEFNDKCPECDSKNFIQIRRVTGYLTGNYKTAFNSAKQQETEMRFKHWQGNKLDK